MKTNINKEGYLFATIPYPRNHPKYGKNTRIYVPIHRAVAEAFVDNPEGLPVVDHINRDKLDNRVSNLR